MAMAGNSRLGGSGCVNNLRRIIEPRTTQQMTLPGLLP